MNLYKLGAAKSNDTKAFMPHNNTKAYSRVCKICHRRRHHSLFGCTANYYDGNTSAATCMYCYESTQVQTRDTDEYKPAKSGDIPIFKIPVVSDQRHTDKIISQQEQIMQLITLQVLDRNAMDDLIMQLNDAREEIQRLTSINSQLACEYEILNNDYIYAVEYSERLEMSMEQSTTDSDSIVDKYLDIPNNNSSANP